MKYFDYIRRLSGTALGFVVFGVAGLVIGLLVFPLLFVFVRDARTRQRAARRLIGKSFGAFVWLINGMGVLSYEVLGRENIEYGRNQLIIANHPTLIDVVFLISMFPESDCVIKGAVTRNPFMRSTVAAANYISNSEPAELLNSCVERLKAGGGLLLFPEGTRSVPGRPIDFKPGAAAVAVRTGVAVLPITIECTPLFLTKDEPWYSVPPKRPHFAIRILPPVTLCELVPDHSDQRRARRAMNEALRVLITSELTDGLARNNAKLTNARSQFL